MWKYQTGKDVTLCFRYIYKEKIQKPQYAYLAWYLLLFAICFGSMFNREIKAFKSEIPKSFYGCSRVGELEQISPQIRGLQAEKGDLTSYIWDNIV